MTGVSNCYVFKSRLQEYAQKASIPTPVYETTKEGPSHEPCFKSTVIVNDVRYDSLAGFFNRKAAEQSAAEIALMDLAKSGNMNECISNPVHETGLCKNLLQEYAQKMNYAIPLYVCRKDETPGKMSFSCTVEIGGIQYIGAAAKTKKEAEIKAARTALLAIQSNAGGPEGKPSASSQFTVVPCKKKGTECVIIHEETAKALKPKKAPLKRKWPKKRFSKNKGDQTNFNQAEQATRNMENVSGAQLENTEMLEVNKDNQGAQHVGSVLDQNDASGLQAVDSGVMAMEANRNFQHTSQGISNLNRNEGEISFMESAAEAQVGGSGILVAGINGNSPDGQPTALNFKQNNQRISGTGNLVGVEIKDSSATVMDVNKVSGDGSVASMVTYSSMGAPETPDFRDDQPSKDHQNGI
ncbi:hypothetical protein HHK36_008179 [Tetracentron sinense]|uniref:DRBM domain-containing protein n=1 Tax=Tetracentron sinense TaxID=13715 RepID=A0A835DN57_TETSI|nr:hypothetical protein HHK36_008179 [Tetracentron sinense]